MAWLQQISSGVYYISFRFDGKKYKRSLKTKSEREAYSKLHRLQDTVRRIEAGWLEIPNDADVPTFLVTEGKVTGRMHEPINSSVSKRTIPTLFVEIFDRYIDSLPNNSLEHSTLETMKIHKRHFERRLGKSFELSKLSRFHLDEYVKMRSKDTGKKGRCICGSTIKKEIRTMITVWNWAVECELIPEKGFPNTKNIKYPKDSNKPKFLPFDDVVRKVADLGPDSEEAALLWESVFLSKSELSELLGHVEKHAIRPFIFPMFVAAAHTGVRRSELLRSQRMDFDSSTMTVREKKRKKGAPSTRQVPLSNLLKKTIQVWSDKHPGSEFTFCEAIEKEYSDCVIPISPRSAHYHFKKALANSTWENLTGWHVFRHSFISNCACDGVDQRMIDAWVGHTTDAMRERYRHLFPNKSVQVLQSVFG